MIRQYQEKDFKQLFEVINDAAVCYENVIPSECYNTPYMSLEYLKKEIVQGVKFWVYAADDTILGVMGIQDVKDVTLIRHAYVRTASRQQGIGGRLLAHLKTLSDRKILIGTWAKAFWAIDFYQKNGFKLIEDQSEKNKLLKKYWDVNELHRENSVVLKQD